MATLENAIVLATIGHRGQMDRAGQPYVTHPLRVMCRMTSDVDRIVAVLHDLVEDTDVKLDDLRRQAFPEAVLAAVDCLTKREGEPYEALIERAAANPIARRVKLADLEDNMDLRRNPAPYTEEDLRRFERYRFAWQRLTEGR